MLRVASRRHPTIGKSDSSTVKLFADFCRLFFVVPNRWLSAEHDLASLCLHRSGPHRSCRYLRTSRDVNQTGKASSRLLMPIAHTPRMFERA